MEKMPPNTINPCIKDTSYVGELPAGLISKTGTDLGDKLLCQLLCD